MRIFAALYLDEDVSVLVAALLRARGFDVTTAREEGMLGRNDGDQLTCAVKLGRSIFTHNRLDFEQLHRAYLSANRVHSGIVIGSRRNPYELARRIAVLLNTLTTDELKNQLLYL